MTGINVTTGLQKAADMINNLDSSKFPLLLQRITQSMQSKHRNEKPFNDEELHKLQTSLNLSESDLKLLLDSITTIIEQAAYHMTKPAILQKQLIDLLKMTNEKAETFANTWASSAKGIVDQLRQRSVSSTQLEDVSWSLHVQAATESRTKQAIPKAVFQFAMNCDEDGRSERENLLVEYNHSELYEFYKQLEVIQGQLDSLR